MDHFRRINHIDKDQTAMVAWWQLILYLAAGKRSDEKWHGKLNSQEMATR